jgi:predicted nucleic acid-binding protein
VSLLVDTSVWSLAFRRDGQPGAPEVGALRAALQGAEQVFTTGLVLQEVLQGFASPKNRDQLVERFSALAFLQPDKQDHRAAAEIRNVCRRRGIQIGTIDALFIQLCQRYDLTLLTTDKDFRPPA